jgi:chaperonin cofactor prefoldin
MKSQEFCNNVYRDLVARLGEIQIQLDQLSQEKKALLAQLKLLNALSPELQKLEEK